MDVKNNPLKFQMPAGGVTIEAMTKDASIEEDEPNILALPPWSALPLLAPPFWHGRLPAGHGAVPENRSARWYCHPHKPCRAALLVWNHAGKPAPAAVLPADATDTQKAIAWAVENDLLKLQRTTVRPMWIPIP